MTNKSYDGKFKIYQKFLFALINKTRFDIVFTLKRGRKSVNQLKNDLRYEQSRISHNLRLLVSHRFVVGERIGKNNFYSLEKDISKILDEFEGFMKNYGRTFNNLKGGDKQ
jgi:predicted transcriptional regulator